MISKILNMTQESVSLRTDLSNDPLQGLYWNVQMQVVYNLTPWTDQQLLDFFMSSHEISIWESLLEVLDHHALLILTQIESSNSIVPLLSVISKVIPLDRKLRMSLRRRLFLKNYEDKELKEASLGKRESPHPLLSIFETSDESTKRLCLCTLLLLFRGNLRFMIRYVPFGYVSAISLQPESYAHLIRTSPDEDADDEDEIISRIGSTEISETNQLRSLVNSRMTPEEKERETDRLIYLLNRLHQTGVVTVPSPEAIEELNRQKFGRKPT